jgi:hypothetical protein
VLTPDRWSERCPLWQEASRAEQADLLKVAWKVQDVLTPWEQDFLARANRDLMSYGRLRPRQIEVLDAGLLKKLWGSDPALWE